MSMVIVEHVEHPFGRGALTSDGIQWSAEHTTTTDDYEAVETVAVTPPALGKVLEFEFGLTCAVRSSGASEGVLFKWQARNRGGGWVDLHPEAARAADASAWQEFTMSGRFAPVAGFDAIPFELRLVVRSASAAGETAAARTKNSSYVKVTYSAS